MLILARFGSQFGSQNPWNDAFDLQKIRIPRGLGPPGDPRGVQSLLKPVGTAKCKEIWIENGTKNQENDPVT